MDSKFYFLFGTDAVDSYESGEPIGSDYEIFCYDILNDHPCRLLDEYNGYGDYALISEELYNELLKRREVSNDN